VVKQGEVGNLDIYRVFRVPRLAVGSLFVLVGPLDGHPRSASQNQSAKVDML